MAFSYTITHRYVVGDRWRAYGTWTTTGATTSGSIVTGLVNIENCGVSDITANRADFTIDYTTTAGTIAITGVTATDTGLWWAEGTY